MTVSINGVEAGRYEIEPFVGHVSFATRKGSVQLRSIHPRALPGRQSFRPPSLVSPTPA